MRRRFGWALAVGLLFSTPAVAAPHWVAAWTASAQGPYPFGNSTAQPDLKFGLPSAETGAQDQSFRLIVRPDVWGKQARIRLSNAYGDKPVTFDGAYVGLQSSGSTLVPHSSHPVTFGGKLNVTVAPGGSAMSDPVSLDFVKNSADPMLANRKLAVSFHVVGDSGKLTWHAKGLTTSYLSGPRTGAHGSEDDEASYPFSTTSWFFLDAIEMDMPGTEVVVAFGDSITDGTASTLNGDDRWPDVFSRRLHSRFGQRYSVVNEGIGGNMVSGPDDYATKPFAGGPSALDRLQRDVISLSHVRCVIWLEGINDFGNAGYDVERASTGVRAGVERLRKAIPGVKIYMALLTSAVNSNNGGYGAPAIEAKRLAYNDFIKKAGIFDGVIDFDTPTRDPATGELKAEFQPNSTTGGPGDRLHPNRAGYAAMGRAIDIEAMFGKK
jgi:lysophospholipase L1-like esterase